MTQLPFFDVFAEQSLSRAQRLVAGRVTANMDAAACGALLVTGSLVTGEADRYSDLDLIVVSAMPTVCAATVVAAIESCGEVLASFTTDHLAEHLSSVYYVEVEKFLVKLDVVYRDNSRPFEIPWPSAILSGSQSDLFDAKAGRIFGVPEKDLDLATTKLGAWLWFTYSRAARGEYFAAARSIDFSRENALLPLILDRLQLPQDGHRRLETRLPGQVYRALEATHPAQLSFPCIFKSLSAMYTLFMDELDLSSLSRKSEIASCAERIWRLVQIDKAQYSL